MRFVNLVSAPDLRLGHLQTVFCVDFTEFTGTVDGAEAKLLFWNVIRVAYMSLNPHLAETESIQSCFVNELSVRYHVVVGILLRGQLMTIIIDPPMRVALPLPPHRTVFVLRHESLRRKHNALVGLEVGLRS